eukprot:6458565-Amphidinium_carterae.2
MLLLVTKFVVVFLGPRQFTWQLDTCAQDGIDTVVCHLGARGMSRPLSDEVDDSCWGDDLISSRRS